MKMNDTNGNHLGFGTHCPDNPVSHDGGSRVDAKYDAFVFQSKILLKYEDKKSLTLTMSDFFEVIPESD